MRFFLLHMVTPNYMLGVLTLQIIAIPNIFGLTYSIFSGQDVFVIYLSCICNKYVFKLPMSCIMPVMSLLTFCLLHELL